MANFTLIPFNQNNKNLNFTGVVNLLETELFITFTLTGSDLNKIDLGTYTPAHQRLKNLWERTCFEFFIKNKSDHYLEFNFSPNFSWNAFYFKEIRGPLNEYQKIENIKFDILNSSDKFFLVARINKIDIQDFLNEGNLTFSLNAVIKYKNNDTEYWALKHMDSKPNFHHFDSFIGKF